MGSNVVGGGSRVVPFRRRRRVRGGGGGGKGGGRERVGSDAARVVAVPDPVRPRVVVVQRELVRRAPGVGRVRRGGLLDDDGGRGGEGKREFGLVREGVGAGGVGEGDGGEGGEVGVCGGERGERAGGGRVRGGVLGAVLRDWDQCQHSE